VPEQPPARVPNGVVNVVEAPGRVALDQRQEAGERPRVGLLDVLRPAPRGAEGFPKVLVEGGFSPSTSRLIAATSSATILSWPVTSAPGAD
jgi:hypothetical protein